MDSQQLKNRQAPLKATYTDNPDAAIAELHATGVIDIVNLMCRVESPSAADGSTVSGLHPHAGGDGTSACSGDMLLQSLVACSGVTLAAVATAMELNISAAVVKAVGVMDFRGTLGVNRETPVGLTSITLTFDLQSAEQGDKLDKLIQLTERFCVVLQTLKQGVAVSSRRS